MWANREQHQTPANAPPWRTSLRFPPKACLSPPTLEPKESYVTEPLQARFEQEIAAAQDLAALDAVRVAALGKSGEVTQLLKSLGGMDAETRTAEAPKIHALREAVTSAIAAKK